MREWMLGAMLLALGLAPAAGAELYRCQRPDGSQVYTDDPAACPGADPYEPAGRITEADAGAGWPAPAAVAPQEARQTEAVERTRWRERKAGLQAELGRVREELDAMSGFLTHCNNGRRLFTEEENGLRRGVSCDEVRERHAALAGRSQELRTQLRDLPDACRRAGCLPGWLR